MCNLREVSQSCNLRNASQRSDNKSGVKGVCWVKATGKWRSYIFHKKRLKHLCQIKSKTEAICYRLAAEQCLGWSTCDPKTTAYNYIIKHLKG